jgi:hypothetical protein
MGRREVDSLDVVCYVSTVRRSVYYGLLFWDERERYVVRLPTLVFPLLAGGRGVSKRVGVKQCSVFTVCVEKENSRLYERSLLGGYWLLLLVSINWYTSPSMQQVVVSPFIHLRFFSGPRSKPSPQDTRRNHPNPNPSNPKTRNRQSTKTPCLNFLVVVSQQSSTLEIGPASQASQAAAR